MIALAKAKLKGGDIAHFVLPCVIRGVPQKLAAVAKELGDAGCHVVADITSAADRERTLAAARTGGGIAGARSRRRSGKRTPRRGALR